MEVEGVKRARQEREAKAHLRGELKYLKDHRYEIIFFEILGFL